MRADQIVLSDGIGFVEYLDHMGDDLAVVNAARVSFKKEKSEFDSKDERLINFLVRNGHWTPMAQVVIKLRIKMPIFVARQYFKHQIGITRNEVSRRYVTDPPEFFLPATLRKASEDKKQGSLAEAVDMNDRLRGVILDQYYEAQKVYDTLLRLGVAAEQARMVLPQATYTEFIETGSLEAYARIVYQRKYKKEVMPDGSVADNTAQEEIREYASAIEQIISRIVPVTMEAKKKGGIV